MFQLQQWYRAVEVTFMGSIPGVQPQLGYGAPITRVMIST